MDLFDAVTAMADGQEATVRGSVRGPFAYTGNVALPASRGARDTM